MPFSLPAANNENTLLKTASNGQDTVADNNIATVPAHDNKLTTAAWASTTKQQNSQRRPFDTFEKSGQ